MDRRSIAAFIVLLLAACSAQPASSPNGSPLPSPAETVTEEAAPSPSATATPEPFGATVFEDPDSCTNEAAGYRVAFPDDWWTNTEYEHDELGTIHACRYFAPDEFDLATATDEDRTPDAVAIAIGHTPGCLGYINPVIDRRDLTIGGYQARAEELAEGKHESNPPLRYQYVIDRQPGADCEGEPNGDHIMAETAPQFAGDYDDNKAVLDRMMETIEVTEPAEAPTLDVARFGSAEFSNPDDCEHPSGRYRIAFPDDWWTNATYEHDELGTIEACQFFSPEAFHLDTMSTTRTSPAGIAIKIQHLDGCFGWTQEIVERRDTAVDGHPAEVVELGGAPGDREPNELQYVIDLDPAVGCEEGGESLVVTTESRDPAGTYEERRAMLERIVRTMRIEADGMDAPP